MHYAISVWNFMENDGPITALVDHFADMGFDTMSFKPEQVLNLDEAAAENLKHQIQNRNLGVTVHADFKLTPLEAEHIISLFNSHLLCLSLDPRCRIDPAGKFFDHQRMIPLLEFLCQRSEGTQVRFGLEDFPLDHCALETNQYALKPILNCQNFGILVDLGHMHLRLNNSEYFSEKGISGYLEGIPLPIIEIHVHDNNADNDQHMPPGQGNLDFADTAATLRQIDFNGMSTLEIAPLRYGAQPDKEYSKVAESLQLWRNLLEQ